jgi:type II secretory pathway pseudopilin PulG
MLELIIMMAIMAIGISSMLWVVETGSYFAKDTEDNIKAINLAREGIEWVTDLRNTNWQRFSSDKINCWKVLNYNSNCIGWTSVPLIASGSYKLYIQNGLWYLSGVTTTFSDIYGTDWAAYKQIYATWLDDRGFYSQTGMTAYSTGCTSELQRNCITQFTREINIDPQWSTGSLLVRSIVRWKAKRDREIILDATLTNWKSKF